MKYPIFLLLINIAALSIHAQQPNSIIISNCLIPGIDGIYYLSTNTCLDNCLSYEKESGDMWLTRRWFPYPIFGNTKVWALNSENDCLGQPVLVYNGSDCNPLNSIGSPYNCQVQALPVELTNFKVILKNSMAQFHWQTASESQNSHFQIQHATDGTVFKNIGQVEGAGTTLEPQEYTFTHRSPPTGLNYYRLQQVDYDGKYSYSKTISLYVGNEKGDIPLAAYPNPVDDAIFLENKSEDMLSVELFDMSGKYLSRIEIDGAEKATLPVVGLETGLYYLKINDGRQVYMQRFVKR